MTIKEVKEQLQEDIQTILEGFGVHEAMEGADYNNLATTLCNAVIYNLNKIEDHEQ